MSRRREAIGLTLVLGIVLAAGTLPVVAGQAQPAANSGKLHCLWKVDGKTNALYLLGSIHFLKEDFYPLDPPIEEAFRTSQVLVVEADFDELTAPQSLLKMLQLGRCPEGETLQSRVSKPTYEKLKEHLKDNALMVQALDGFRPWMAAVTLMAMELQRLGFDPSQGVDQYFYKRAKKDGKKIVPLETADFQMNLFSGLAGQDEDAMLKETLDEISKFKPLFNDMIQAWKSGDSAKLEEMVLESMRKYPDLYQKLLVKRNENWCRKLQDLMKQGKPVFVVVGTAHVVGKDSVVSMLRKQGLNVRQF